jgi:hypothetical protein
MRQMVFHGFYQTDGHGGDHEPLANPRFDFPPGINFEPWYHDHHAAFAIESARLSAFLDHTDSPPRIALLWPLRSIWTDGQTAIHAKHFGTWAKILTESGLDFDIIDERDLLGTAPGGRGLERFDAIILPHVTTLRSAVTTQVLGALAEEGVHLVASGTTPLVYQLGDQTAVADWRAVPTTMVDDPTVALEVLQQTRPMENLIAGGGEASLRLRTGTDPAGRTRLAAFNDGDAPIVVTLPPGFAATEWHPLDGRRTRVDAAAITLAPNALRLFVCERIGDREAIRPGVAAVGPEAGTGAERPAVDRPAVDGAKLVSLDVGWSLTLPGVQDVSEPVRVDAGWEGDFPEYSGIGTYEITLGLDPERHHELLFPSIAGSITVFIDGQAAGSRGWAPFRLPLPPQLVTGSPLTIRVDVASGAGNRYYAGTGLRSRPEPSGITSTPTLRSFS